MEYFPGFPTLQLCGIVTDLLSRLGETPESFTGRILFMSMFNDIFCEKTMKKNVWQMLVSILAKKFGIGQWSFLGPGSEKKCYCMEEDSPQGIWSHRGKDAVGICGKRMINFPCNNSIVQRSTQKQRTR